MEETGEIWGLVLAAGEGSRLRTLTAAPDGAPVPKQYCALVDRRSLLRTTLDRMTRLLPRRRIVVVVAEAHRPHWERELADWPAENVVVQPQNRGTAAGLLLPLLAILGRDPKARVLVTPSDHHVGDEPGFLAAMAEALSAIERPLDRVVMLGIEPERAAESADGYGWIVPRRRSIGAPRSVERFVEKPAPAEAAALAARGALWNSFVFAARGETLLALYVRRLPALLDAMVDAVLPRRPQGDRAGALTALYGRIEARDFSRDLLAGSEDALLVLPTPDCGWTDLGTPERLAQCRAALPQATTSERGAVTRPSRRPVAAVAMPAMA